MLEFNLSWISGEASISNGIFLATNKLFIYYKYLICINFYCISIKYNIHAIHFLSNCDIFYLMFYTSYILVNLCQIYPAVPLTTCFLPSYRKASLTWQKSDHLSLGSSYRWNDCQIGRDQHPFRLCWYLMWRPSTAYSSPVALFLFKLVYLN